MFAALRSAVAFLLLLAPVPAVLLAQTSPVAASLPRLTGTWTGTSAYRGQQVPVTLQISGPADHLQAALVNGPGGGGATGLDRSQASSVQRDGSHLLINFNYFNNTLDLALQPDGKLTGSFGPPPAPDAPARIPVELSHGSRPAPARGAPRITGPWEIAVHSRKGEAAWTMQVHPSGRPGEIRAVIQRIDGDTGSLFGLWNGTSYLVGHFNAEGPSFYSLTPRGSELRVTNLLASAANKPISTDLVARRPAEARREHLPAPTRSTDQTSLKNPQAPLRFSGTTLDGRHVDQNDPSLRGKVILLAIGGSWCPNCHDEAPFLESLYRTYRDRGLEVLDLDFEDAGQLKNPTRVRAFIARYGLTYPVLLAGTTDDLNTVIPGVVNLNSWPTSFFIGRDGRVKEIHAGFAGPANPQGNAALRQEITALVERLLAQPTPAHLARR